LRRATAARPRPPSRVASSDSALATDVREAMAALRRRRGIAPDTRATGDWDTRTSAPDSRRARDAEDAR
jgi:hypothetical protein